LGSYAAKGSGVKAKAKEGTAEEWPPALHSVAVHSFAISTRPATASARVTTGKIRRLNAKNQLAQTPPFPLPSFRKRASRCRLNGNDLTPPAGLILAGKRT
jgi:hypothetical protein